MSAASSVAQVIVAELVVIEPEEAPEITGAVVSGGGVGVGVGVGVGSGVGVGDGSGVGLGDEPLPVYAYTSEISPAERMRL